MPKKKTEGTAAAKSELATAKENRSAKAAAPKPGKTQRTHLIIDYPLEGEIVVSLAYTIRLSALEPRSVEVSVDGKEWRPCRESVGHWWYDWAGYRAGPYTLTARMTSAAGKTAKSKPRQFTVLV